MSQRTTDNRPIGIFDSGMGGISVLGEAIRQLPNESFIYYGDAANAPYGEKSTEAIIELSDRVCKQLLSRDVKAIVIACNTATSAAADTLRKKHPQVPILGMEPALKPAVQVNPEGTIVVMATEVTLREKKFAELMDRTADQAKVVKLPCPSLVRMVERSVLTGPEAESELKHCFQDLDFMALSAIVLGCTHFVFLRKALKSLLGERIQLFDGNVGTIKNLSRILEQRGLRANKDNLAAIELQSSLDEVYTERMRQLLEIYDQVVV